MKINKIFLALSAGMLLFASCDEFLDVNPDNRATVDTEEKVIKLLTSAYSNTDYVLVSELMSDNVDEYTSSTFTDRLVEQIYAWEDVTETDNGTPESIWSGAYSAIANANEALAAIEELGGPTTEALKQAKAEALITRAYHHFLLVNLFAKNYNSKTSATDLGITYMTKSETTLDPKYERNTVAEVYDLIEKDLLEALPNVGDLNYSVPKYHFNQKAAYAFAAKFFLFYEKWDEAIKYADLCLGSSPKSMLRDWQAYNALSQDFEVLTRNYIDASHKANLLLSTAYSEIGLVFGPYGFRKRFIHGTYLANTEDGNVTQVWGNPAWYSGMHTFQGSGFDFTIFYKLPYLFEFTDPVSRTGYAHTVQTIFTADETLIIRAEAKALKGDFQGALDDMNIWLHNISATKVEVTLDMVNSYYGSMAYATWMSSTPKKHLHPAFAIGAEGSDQENLLQFILHMKRIETLQLGQRWFDVKRYGIEIWRRQMDATGNPSKLTDVLKVDDERRAVQIPQKVIDANYTPNPRANTSEDAPFLTPIN